jgi:hypothetical protein
VPADIGRLFRACLCSVARRLGTPGAAGGSSDLGNLTTLCAAHHQRGVTPA